ncbi:TPA: hypothetical protein ACGXNJ_002948 [Bacillus cereus]
MIKTTIAGFTVVGTLVLGGLGLAGNTAGYAIDCIDAAASEKMPAGEFVTETVFVESDMSAKPFNEVINEVCPKPNGGSHDIGTHVIVNMEAVADIDEYKGVIANDGYLQTAMTGFLFDEEAVNRYIENHYAWDTSGYAGSGHAAVYSSALGY